MASKTDFHTRIMDKFGARLTKAREAKYRSAQRFAKKMGIHPHTYRKYERGETQPDFETLVRMCDDLGVTPNDLLPDAAAA